MPTILQTAIRNLAILTLTVVWSAYTVVRLLADHWRAYRTLPKGKSAWDLFAPKVHKRPAVLDEEWRHGFLQLSEIRMHYVESGDRSKPLMVCLHGFPEFWYSYRFQLRYFAKDYRVVAVDLRGYNETDKPVGISNYDIGVLSKDICEAIEQLGGPAILIGHDWGGLIAWTVALRRPDLLTRLIALNAPHPKAFLKTIRTSAAQLWKSWYMFLFQSPLLAEFYLSSLDFRFVESLRSKAVGLSNPQNMTDEDVDAWKYVFSQSGALTPPVNYYRAGMRAVGRSQVSAETIQTKTLLVWGERDAFLEPAAAQLSLQLCRDARLERVANASHWLQQDVPELLNTLIQTFLSEAE